ncbi:hypothetical protein D3C78_1644120 [compost metagenome]
MGDVITALLPQPCAMRRLIKPTAVNARCQFIGASFLSCRESGTGNEPHNFYIP